MDLQMPRLNGVEATGRITAEYPATKVLVLTTFEQDEYVYAALRAGAGGFLLKDAPPADLLTGIRVVAAGDALLAPRVARRLISEFTAGPGRARVLGSGLGSGLASGRAALTGREREVLALVAQGLSNAEIADRLGVGITTVKTHVAHLLTKLEARNRVQLVIVAYRAGVAG